MNKIKTLLKAPLETQSGYGKHSKQIFESLISDPLFDVSVESLNWGNCSWDTQDTPLNKKIKQAVEKRAMEAEAQQNDYDLFVHVTIPNEFERRGKFNIGVSALCETDRISHQWIQKLNEMDLNIVPSEHSKRIVETTIADWHNPQTGEKGKFKVEKPIVVCAEGVNTELFTEKPYQDLLKLELEPEFCFLHVGQWGGGNFGEDRKNISNLLKYFFETFRGRKDVGLVLKTNMSKNNAMDFETVKFRINDLRNAIKIPEAECPPLYIVHANLTTEEMADLYNHPKIKAFITLTHGEGFGIPVLEAAAVGLPILATNWSGHLDILKDGKFVSFEHELKDIPESVVWDPILIKGSRWACVVEDDVKKKMDKITRSYSKPKEWAKELAGKVRDKFSTKNTNDSFITVVKQHLLKGVMQNINPEEYLRSFIDTPEAFNIIFTMPRSTGDVFIATAVVNGLMKQVPAEAKLYFATDPQYFDILKDNPDVYKCIPYNQTMMQVELLEEVFDLALTPDTATQYLFSNWTRKGNGRLLAEEYAEHCHTELGDYVVPEDTSLLYSIKELTSEASQRAGEFDIDEYATLHVGSGQGQWEGRNYRDWNEVIHNLKLLFPTLKIAQVGAKEDMKINGVDVDLRGKTTFSQLASVIEHARLHVGIDSFPMHLAAATDTPLVAIFGCSWAGSTGPWVKDKKVAKYILLQSERKSGCVNRPCYKNRCKHNPVDGAAPLNEIDSKEIFAACAKLLVE